MVTEKAFVSHEETNATPSGGLNIERFGSFGVSHSDENNLSYFGPQTLTSGHKSIICSSPMPILSRTLVSHSRPNRPHA